METGTKVTHTPGPWVVTRCDPMYSHGKHERATGRHVDIELPPEFGQAVSDLRAIEAAPYALDACRAALIGASGDVRAKIELALAVATNGIQNTLGSGQLPPRAALVEPSYGDDITHG